jgi:signal transduction histidine kinase
MKREMTNKASQDLATRYLAGLRFRFDNTLSSKANKRLGLLGMRERVEMVGGALNIDSSLGRGTTVGAATPTFYTLL